jgi:hypothetical protein
MLERRRFLAIACSATLFLFLLLLHFSQFSIESDYLDSTSLSSTPPLLLFVIPGGGSGSEISGYPEWTSRRTLKAYEKYLQQPFSLRNHVIFLALSAGSLNSPNRRLIDDRIIFECQKTIDHLNHLGVPKDQVFGDFLSWDTVTNGLALRLFLEGYLATHPSYDSVNIEVFISDFHATRVKVSFEWILRLSPSLLTSGHSPSVTSSPHISLVVHEVSSTGLFENKTLQERLRHEALGVQKIFENQNKIRTIQQFYGFLFAGGHQGLWRYLHGEYTDGGTKVGY